jgi:putative copper resistance protein D
MDGAPGIAEVLSHFSLDIPWLVTLVFATALYAIAYRRAAARGSHHPRPRLVSFMAGIALIAIAVMSPLEYYGNQLLWVNFTGFLIITMIAAPLVVLGSPLTLAFRVASPGRRASLRSFYRRGPFAVLTFPVLSWLLFAVVTYIWQLTSLMEVAAENAAVRDLQQASLLAVGLLFWIPPLLADPVRWRMAYPLRAMYLFVEMTHKALFGAMFLSVQTPIHEDFAANTPAWALDPMDDQQLAILILWIGGNVIFLFAMAYVIGCWLAYERRNSHRVDWRLRLRREAQERRRQAMDQVFRKSV